MQDTETETFKSPGSRGLWQSEDKYKAIISVLSEGIVIMTKDGIQESNASADRILGMDRDGQDGCVSEDPTVELFNADGSPLAREDHPCFITLATGEAFSNVIIGFRRPCQPITWCSLNTRPVFTIDAAHPDTVVASVRDVTVEITARLEVERSRREAERRAYELDVERQRLEALLAELQVERELRENFVNTLTHDLRTPLTVAMFGAQKLMKGADGSDAVRHGAEKIAGSIRRLDQMVRDLLDANRLHAGRGMPLKKQKISLGLLIGQCCDVLSLKNENKIFTAGEVDVVAEVCPNSMRRVLENLIGNALKYGDSLRPVTISLHDHVTSFVIQVHNHGPTIPQEDLKTLFDPYTRSRSPEHAQVKGWGLGLVLVKGIVEAHGGTVDVCSEDLTGTQFTVRLPKYHAGF